VPRRAAIKALIGTNLEPKSLRGGVAPRGDLFNGNVAIAIRDDLDNPHQQQCLVIVNDLFVRVAGRAAAGHSAGSAFIMAWAVLRQLSDCSRHAFEVRGLTAVSAVRTSVQRDSATVC
jgi:hypothetical protein